MPAVHIEEVDFAYSSAVVVFAGLTLHIGDGWTGVVGPNGAGKSTLLSLVSGDLSPDSGRISIDPSGALVVRCHQEVDSPDAGIERMATSPDGGARKWMGRLGLDPAHLERWPTLSPGERKRWQIASALASDPEILLLDEPTNHLDADALSQVTSALGRFNGVGLAISHDRAFLDGLTSRTIRVGAGSARLWSGSYTTAHDSWTAEEQARLDRYDTAKRQERAAKRRLADERRNAETRSARFKRQLREAGPSDHDARSLAAKGRHAEGEAAGAQRLSVARANLDRASSVREELGVEGDLGGSIFFDYEPSPKPLLFQYDGPLRVGDVVLAERVDVGIGREDRILLTGPNGAGKSTLLSALHRTSSLPRDRMLHLPQEITREEGAGLLESLSDLTKERRGRVLSVVAALGVDPDELLASRLPSPGEVRKLALAIGLGVNSWCLLLDEPTNHLDVEAVERVEAALARFPGAMVIVTHDRAFARATTNTAWRLDEGRLEIQPLASDR